MRTALKGALATLDRETGHPYASLVLVATEPDGAPILLLSRLALHTRNLERDPRASLLLDGYGWPGRPPRRRAGDPLGMRGRAPAPPRGAAFWRGIPPPKAMPALPTFPSISLGFERRITSAVSAASSICRRQRSAARRRRRRSPSDRGGSRHRRAHEQRSCQMRSGFMRPNLPALRPGPGACRHRSRGHRSAALHNGRPDRFSRAQCGTRRGTRRLDRPGAGGAAGQAGPARDSKEGVGRLCALAMA